MNATACRATAAILLAAGVSIAGSASAGVITDARTIAQDVTKKNSLSFRHDITDDGFAVGLDEITSATLVIVLGDDNEKAEYKIAFGPQVLSGDDSIKGEKAFEPGLSVQSLAELAATGVLEMSISAKGCNGNASKCPDKSFRFLSSTLTVDVTRPAPAPQAAAAVPEPGTLSLLGLAIAGLGALRVRRSRGRVATTTSRAS